MSTQYLKAIRQGLILTTGSVVTMAMLIIPKISEATTDDPTLEVHGFAENATFVRDGRGLSKFRNTGQIEVDKDFGESGSFSSLSFHGTFRATYDGVYDLNADEFGDRAGGPITLEQVGVPAGTLGPGAPAVPAAQVPFGSGLVLPGGDFDSAANPNDGLVVLGSELHATEGGVALGVPVRPCDKDSRGCIPDYLDKDSNDLRHPEFNDRLDFIREAYVDAMVSLDNGHRINFKLGRQQVVWGRTDLFRVLDVINPIDFSRHNIFDELEDIRIPTGIFTAEYLAGPTKIFDDFNVQFVWNFENFRPHDLGQGGQPYAILDAGSFFRAMKNCWDNGCTVGNFAGFGVATDFAPNTIGIRRANVPGGSLDETQYGIKVEGVYKGVGFSLNAYRFWSQLPSLRGGIPSDNPFTPAVESATFPFLISFDIDFPRVNLFGGSLDWYADSIKSVFRLEAAYTTGEEFVNTSRPRLFSESDVFRWVLGIDRNTFIPFLNKRRAFLISGQLFGQHLLDHESFTSAADAAKATGAPIPFATSNVGMPDWEDNYIATLLVKGFYMNDRLSPQVILAHDYRARATAVAPSIDWLISNNWRLTFGANFKLGPGARKYNDCRDCNPFSPATASPLHVDADGDGLPDAGPIGLAGFEPLGRFRAGPIGMARQENELQLTVRYRF